MKKESVLFVCIHNSARSQMAEALMNHLGADKYLAESAGIEPGSLNPLAVEAMQQIGINIAKHQTKGVDAFIQSQRQFSWVITVCDDTNAERCPLFPGNARKLHWSFQDPSQFAGSHAEKLAKTIQVRDQIKARIQAFLADPK